MATQPSDPLLGPGPTRCDAGGQSVSAYLAVTSTSLGHALKFTSIAVAAARCPIPAATIPVAKAKRHVIRWSRDTKLMRNLKDEAQKKAYITNIIIVITVLGVMMSLTKSCLFHMEAVGRWDHGHPYKFSYALSLTMVVFVLKMLLAPIKICLKPKPSKVQEDDDDDDEAEAPKTILDHIMPWVLLVVFTTFEMLMATLSSLGLLYGAPTTVFVVFKSSKAVFMALMSVVILGRRLNAPQWCSLLVISGALLLSTVAEGKGGKPGKGSHEINLEGPLLLLLSELCHAMMLIFQEIAVRQYWPNPVSLLSWSASFGAFLTACSMYKSRTIFVDLPDGGRRPFCDPEDVLFMMSTSPALAICLLMNVTSHLTSDVAHIMILKHISALARTLCDTLKMILMWLLGKGFWLLAILPPLAEPWHPGLLGSWLMIPAIGAVVYGMLMFKNAVFVPLTYAKDDDGVWRIQEVRQEVEGEDAGEVEELVTNMDDPFYMEAFRSRQLKKRNLALLGRVR
ncbi:SLC35F6 [Symbiodinium pilosum]|uniref:SLC35F6 protein n=1 Tax=Symbiodinium pilosum TaxID=2952 RepID=A0A812W9Q8_SYMPI|nr:SLC35F6 [Symbiodinium pilosum]